MRASEEGGGCFPTGRHYPGIAHLLRIVAQGLADEVDGSSSIHDVVMVSIDTETTGMDPAVDRIVELAAVVYHRGETISAAPLAGESRAPDPEGGIRRARNQRRRRFRHATLRGRLR